VTASHKTVLVIGLGNPLMGDEGIGWHVAERLRQDPRLPAHAKVAWAGTDLLRFAPRMEESRHVILVDALLDENRPGRLEVVRGGLGEFDLRQGHVHGLSALQTIELLRLVTPALSSVRFTLALIGISSAALGPGLSSPLAAAVPGIIDGILDELRREAASPPAPAKSPVKPESGDGPFQTCGSCKLAWPTWESFLFDPAVRLLGFQSALAHPELNLLVFEHRCGSSISILTRRLRHLLPDQREGTPHVALYGSEECEGHCRLLDDLEVCEAPCANARDRNLILLVRHMKRSSSRTRSLASTWWSLPPG
jgi:hydrogenase maturation protease